MVRLPPLRAPPVRLGAADVLEITDDEGAAAWGERDPDDVDVVGRDGAGGVGHRGRDGVGARGNADVTEACVPAGVRRRAPGPTRVRARRDGELHANVLQRLT